MEIGSVAHKYYLINIRLPVNERKGINVGIGEIKDIRLVVSVCLASLHDVCPGPAAAPFLSPLGSYSSLHIAPTCKCDFPPSQGMPPLTAVFRGAHPKP